ncbi:MAG: cupin domain-containing protein [Chroococcidiopsidaceae cyanobacterium CP_BM_ER_R8_30]|nr:cupin domain-containing protein [Chroococcidiopsidaceae cyanobacterium CP_BM_ER_R8_30]
MVQAMNMHRAFHLQLLLIGSLPHQAINLEIVQHSYARQTMYQQNLMSLGTEAELLEICDAKDVTLTVLEGQGSLTLYEEVLTLEPGMFVFIPAQTPHTLRTQASLIFLLVRCEPEPF